VHGKIGGAAQKRLAGGAVLHHVTMACDIDANALASHTPAPAGRPRATKHPPQGTCKLPA
jgi:lipoate-protein ligase A